VVGFFIAFQAMPKVIAQVFSFKLGKTPAYPYLKSLKNPKPP
jgi:hypothetical protein